MKKLILVVVLLFIVSPVFASERIDTLLAEIRQIDQAIAQRNQQIAQLTTRKLENVGGIKELRRIEDEKVVEEVK